MANEAAELRDGAHRNRITLQHEKARQRMPRLYRARANAE
jgi:hypothetical protein